MGTLNILHPYICATSTFLPMPLPHKQQNKAKRKIVDETLVNHEHYSMESSCERKKEKLSVRKGVRETHLELLLRFIGQQWEQLGMKNNVK